jgi:16S rRNA (guanine(1405)-N(7))-methyltransferase
MSADLEALIAGVRSSAKYRALSPALVQAVAEVELGKRRSARETLKAVRSKLHQVAGGFLAGGLDYERTLAALRSNADDQEALRRCCAALMAGHASTRERLPILGPLYERLFARLGPVGSILDLGCGLNPLAIPWMPLASGCTYHAYDVQTDLVDFLDAALPVLGVTGGAHLADLTQETIDRPADLALALKVLPSLEQLDRRAGARLLEALHVNHVVVSFPARSLGGREKGMLANYEARFRRLIAGRPWPVERLDFPTELVFIATTGAGVVD